MIEKLQENARSPACTAFGSGLIKTGGNRSWTFCVTVLGLISSSGLPRGGLRG
jgi:hypothetical protein